MSKKKAQSCSECGKPLGPKDYDICARCQAKDEAQEVAEFQEDLRKMRKETGHRR